jgi:hypothetical protein
MMKRGDLVHIPSEVTLYQFEEANRTMKTVARYKKTNKPVRVLVVEKLALDNWYKILYDGETWYANQSDVYDLNNGV